MTLRELITELKTYDPKTLLPMGLGSPHSYRGFFDQLGFAPVRNTTIGKMLEEAEGCVGKSFQGYKGGNYKMEHDTDVWMSTWGDSGEALCLTLIRYMCGAGVPDNKYGLRVMEIQAEINSHRRIADELESKLKGLLS